MIILMPALDDMPPDLSAEALLKAVAQHSWPNICRHATILGLTIMIIELLGFNVNWLKPILLSAA